MKTGKDVIKMVKILPFDTRKVVGNAGDDCTDKCKKSTNCDTCSNVGCKCDSNCNDDPGATQGFAVCF
jgi:hypothetical protein